MAMALHYTHTLWNAISAGDMHGYEWVLSFFLKLFPITVMYLLVVIFHIRATSSPLSALVFMSQIVVYTIRLNVPLHMYIENELTGFLYIPMQVLLVLFGIWSLDFFRSVVPPFCVSSNIKTVHAIALEYLVAFHPIFLILLTYICIKLHDNNFRPVVCLWKPFHRCFVLFRRSWDSTASIVNAFTTLLLLSFSNQCSLQSSYEKKVCSVLRPDSGMPYTRVFHICSNRCLCVGYIYSFSNSFSHFVPHKTVQVCLMLWISQVARSARLWNHFRDSTRMEPMVLMTSEWFLHHSSSSGY